MKNYVRILVCYADESVLDTQEIWIMICDFMEDKAKSHKKVNNQILIKFLILLDSI